MKNNKKHLIKLFFLHFILSFTFISCDDTITVDDVDNNIIPDSLVSFSKHIYPVFQVKCALSGCHVNPNPKAGLDLTTWANVTADPSIVFPGFPDLSSLVWSIEGLSSSKRMPPSGYSTLTFNQINGIRTWIKEGAEDN